MQQQKKSDPTHRTLAPKPKPAPKPAPKPVAKPMAAPTSNKFNDAGEFKRARDTFLNTFKAEYEQLKTIYTDTVKAAIAETDKAHQSTLIKRVLDTNQSMLALINGFTGNMNHDQYQTNPNLRGEISEDMKTLKAEYEKIQQGAVELGGLKSVIERTKADKKEVTDMFHIYAVWMFVAIAVLIYVIITRGPSLSAFNTKPSMPVISGGHR